jgi:hypothetical protein
MNRDRRKRLTAILEALEPFKDELEELRDEEQEAFDNLPESIQDGEQGQTMNEAIDQLEEAMASIRYSDRFDRRGDGMKWESLTSAEQSAVLDAIDAASKIYSGDRASTPLDTAYDRFGSAEVKIVVFKPRLRTYSVMRWFRRA